MDRPHLAALVALGNLCLGRACVSQPGECDGIIDVGEQCDDGNDDPEDGCVCDVPIPWPAPAPRAADPSAPVVLVEDGAWCWFQDERAVFVGEELWIATLSHEGDVQVSTYDPRDGRRDHALLHRHLERDDHDAASLLPLEDGRVVAFYTKHDGSETMYWRSTEPGGDLSSWGREETFDIADGTSYSNSYTLGAEGRDEPRMYLFFRGLRYNPTFVASDDGGATWSPPGQILDSHEDTILGRVDHRPYVRYVSDGADTVHLLYTEGHPSEFTDNSLYHLYYRDDALYRSDGTVVAPMKRGELPRLDPREGTKIYDGVRDPGGEAWTWDAALDAERDPVVVFASFSQGERGTGHQYRYARWDGARWRQNLIAPAGRRIYRDEPFYSGGIALDPDDPDVVYFSSTVDPVSGGALPGGHFELFRGVTDDDGATWRFTQLTRDSIVDNLRPIVPPLHPEGTVVLWMQGTYDSYIDYDLRIVGLFGDAEAVAVETEPAEEPLALVARFDVGGAPAEGGVLRMTGDAAQLVLDEVTGERDAGVARGLYRDLVYADAGGYGRGDKLLVQVEGLEAGGRYVLRLHGHDTREAYLTTTLWFQAEANGLLYVDGNRYFLGGHRAGNSVGAAEGHVDLLLEANAGGVIAVVGRGLNSGGDDQIALLSGVEVFRRPETAPVARFDVATGDPVGEGDTLLAFDPGEAWGGSATAGGLTMTVWTDRLDSLRERGGGIGGDFVFADDELLVELAGLEVGRTYEITVHSVDLERNLYDASHWWLEEPGAQPRVVRSFHMNARSSGPSSSFTFYHRATQPSFRLRGRDVLYALSTQPSVVLLGGIEVRTIATPPAAAPRSEVTP